MTTRQPIAHFVDVLGGMNATTPPHLLKDTVWSSQENFKTVNGSIIQVPDLFNLGVVSDATGITHIRELNKVRGRATFFALSQTKAYQFFPNDATDSLALTDETGAAVNFTSLADPNIALCSFLISPAFTSILAGSVRSVWNSCTIRTPMPAPSAAA